MTFSEKFIDHVIIDEQFINAYITIRDHLCLKEKKTVDILDCEKQVDTAIRDCMNHIDWLKEKDATGVILRAMFKAFADYSRKHGLKYEWSIGKPTEEGYTYSSCHFRIVGIVGED